MTLPPSVGTPIYDELRAELGTPPACEVCGDYALHISRLINLAIDFTADAYDVLGLGIGDAFRQLARGIEPELTESILGGPR